MSLSLLRRCPLLKSLPGRKLRQVLRFSRACDFPKGSRIFSKADLAGHMFIVAAGRVKIYASSGARKRKTHAYLGPGDFFGEMALLDSGVRSASAEAVEASRILVIQSRDFRRFLLSDPRLCYFLLRTLSQRLRLANDQVESLLFRNILGRVAKTLLDLSRRDGKPSRGGPALSRHYTRQELADLVGTTREPLSRALASLQRAGLVKLQKARIHLSDPARLEILVGAF